MFNRRIWWWFTALGVAATSGPFPCVAQERDTTYSLVLYAGGGFTRNLTKWDPPLPGLKKTGFGGFVRVMWHPEHLLSVGLETGFAQVYYVAVDNMQTPFGETDYSSYLSVVPLELAFSMPIIGHLQGYIGSTSFFMFSRTESFGNTAKGFALSIGFTAGLSYLWPINEKWALGCELKWYHIEKTWDDNMMAYVLFSYRFLEW